MGKTGVILPIFCINKETFDFNKDSLLSLSNFLKDNPHSLTFSFGGYCKEKYKNDILEILKKNFKGSDYTEFPENFGKAFVINNLVKSFLNNYRDTKYIFTMDSDMLFLNKPSNSNLFERLENLMENNLFSKKLGIIALNMEGDQAHWLNNFENMDIFKKEILSWPNQPVGIAGGSLFISVECWKKINGYRLLGVYAPDDAYLFRDSFDNGFQNLVIETLTLFHPGTHNNKIYQSWKERTARLNMSFSESVDYTKEFWDNNCKDVEEKSDFSNICFMVHYRKDSEDRLDNLINLVKFYKKYTKNSQFIICEDDKESSKKVLFKKLNLDKNDKYMFFKNDSIYKRTLCFNKMLKNTKRLIVIAQDTDVIIKTENLIKAQYKILNESFDMVYPYNGVYLCIDKTLKNIFIENLNLNIFYDNIKNLKLEIFNKNEHVTVGHNNSLGGCIMFNKENLIKSNGYNSNFIGWGYEDNEIYIRYLKLNNKICRITNKNAVLWHLDHKNIIRTNHEFYSLNKNIFDNLCSINNNKDLNEYLTKWSL